MNYETLVHYTALEPGDMIILRDQQTLMDVMKNGGGIVSEVQCKITEIVKFESPAIDFAAILFYLDRDDLAILVTYDSETQDDFDVYGCFMPFPPQGRSEFIDDNEDDLWAFLLDEEEYEEYPQNPAQFELARSLYVDDVEFSTFLFGDSIYGESRTTAAEPEFTQFHMWAAEEEHENPYCIWLEIGDVDEMESGDGGLITFLQGTIFEPHDIDVRKTK